MCTVKFGITAVMAFREGTKNVYAINNQLRFLNSCIYILNRSYPFLRKMSPLQVISVNEIKKKDIEDASDAEKKKRRHITTFFCGNLLKLIFKEV